MNLITRRQNIKIPPIYWLYLILIIASVLTYTSSSSFAIFQDWDPYHFQKARYISRTPSYQRFLKDILIIVLFICSIIYKPERSFIQKRRFSNLHIFYILSLFIIAISIARNLDTNVDIKLVLMSTRPMFYLLTLILFCHRHLNSVFLLKVLSYSNFLLVIQFIYAVLQRFQAVINQGISIFSLGHMRSVGTFAGPNSLGLYLSLMLIINLYVLRDSKYLSYFSSLCLVGIYLSGSRTSIMIAILVLALKLKDKIIGKFSNSLIQRFLFDLILFIPAFLYLPFYVKDISDRGGSDVALEGTRREIFTNLLSTSDIPSLLFGHYLGYGSNAVVTYQKEIGVSLEQSYSFIADSTPSYLIAQFGFFVFPLIILFFLRLWFSKNSLQFSNKSVIHKPKTAIFAYLLCSSLTIILFEFYVAMIILVPLCFLLADYPLKSKQASKKQFSLS